MEVMWEELLSCQCLIHQEESLELELDERHLDCTKHCLSKAGE